MVQVAANWAVILASSLVAVLASVGSVRSLIVAFGSYEFFS